MDIAYRLRQFWYSVTAGPLPGSVQQEIDGVLNSGELALFRQMSDSDQWHAYRVYSLLLENGHTDGDLLAAALLHDVGKVRANLSVWDRSVAVLGETFTPQKVDAWGDSDAKGWKQTFVIRKQHATWGAELAHEAGARPAVINLIRRHQDPVPAGGGGDERLALLQWADDQN